MTDGKQPLPTKERLAQELEKLPTFAGQDRLVKRARAAFYDDYESHLALPTLQLVDDLMACRQHAMVKRVANGEFDGTKEESEAWMKSPEGQGVLKELLFPSDLAMEADRKCPYCGESNISSMGTKPGGPDEGDASLCMYCEKWAVFDAELLLRKPTDDELKDILGNVTAQKAVEAVWKWKKQQGKKDQ